MTDQYVPINSSDLPNFIPPNEEIVYSTLCEIIISIGVTTYKGTYGSRGTTYSISYPSHLIITPLGFAYFCKPFIDDIEPYGEPIPTYNSLLNILKFSKRGFSARHIDNVSRWPYKYKFRLVHIPDIETKEEFKNRLETFKLKLAKYMKGAAEHLLNYINKNKNKDEKDYSPLWKVNKSILMDNYDPHLREYLNSDKTHKDSKETWEYLKRNKAPLRITYKFEYLDILKQTITSYAHENSNIAYIRTLIDTELNNFEVKTYIHLEEFHSKLSEDIVCTGVTPKYGETDYRSIFHKKAAKKLLGTIATLDKFILKQEKS